MPRDNPSVEEVKAPVVTFKDHAGYVLVESDEELERKFRLLADQWRRETRYISSLSKMSMHSAYQKIVGMGKPAIPLILRELQKSGGHWLWALHVITDEDPAPVDADFDEAVSAWLNWGKRNHFIE